MKREDESSDAISAGARSLFGFLRPLAARAQYLHRELWTTYQRTENPVVRGSTPGGALSFKYAELVQQLYLRDHLLLVGLPEMDPKAVAFVTDDSTLDTRLDQLPAPIRRAIAEVHQRGHGRLVYLYRTLDLLCQLHLIEPVLPGQLQARAATALSTHLHFEYTLVPSVDVPRRPRFHFSDEGRLSAYWTHLRLAVTAKNSINMPMLAAEWRAPVEVLSGLRKLSSWRYRVLFSQWERNQLHVFAEYRQSPTDAEGRAAAMLDMAKVARAASLTHTTPPAAATVLARVYFPKLAAVHDEVKAYEEAFRNSRMPQPASTPKQKRRRRKQKAEDAEDAFAVDFPEVEDEPISAVDLTASQEWKRAVAAVDSADELKQTEESPAPTPIRRGGRGGKRGARSAKAWSAKEDDELLAMYNDWLDAQQAAGALPFTFTAPPRVDLSEGDGLGMLWSVPFTSSLSSFATSFHSLLPLMWLDQVEAEPGSRPPASSVPGPEEPSAKERVDALLEARRDFVLHRTPIPPAPSSPPPPAETAASDDEQVDDNDPDDRSAHSKDDAKDDAEEKDDVEEMDAVAEQKEERRPARFGKPVPVAASSALLKPLYSIAGKRFPSRGARQVQHRLDVFRTRLDLPIGFSSSTRRKPILSMPYTVAHVAGDPVLVALLTLHKVIFLEPAASYLPANAHYATREYTGEQVALITDVLKADRWIVRRKGTHGGTERSWTLSTACRAILLGKKDERPSLTDWSAPWAHSDLGQQIALTHPLQRAQLDAVVEAAARWELSVLLPRVGDDVEDFEEDEKAELNEERKDDSAMAVEEKAPAEEKAAVEGADAEGAKKPRKRQLWPVRDDSIDQASLKATRVDLYGSSVSLLSTRWPLVVTDDSNIIRDDAMGDEELPANEDTPPDDPVMGAEVGMTDHTEPEAGADDVLLVHIMPRNGDGGAEKDGGVSFTDSDECIARSGRLVEVLEDAGAAGLSREELAARLNESDDLVDEAVQHALCHALALRVFSYDHQRFVAARFSSHWTFPHKLRQRRQQQQETGKAEQAHPTAAAAEEQSALKDAFAEDDAVDAVVAHPWRLMSGDLNEELWSSLYHSVLRSIRQWPGIKEDRLLAMFPVLMPTELHHILHTLLMDDVISRRSWTHRPTREADEELPSDRESAEQLVTCFFPLSGLLDL